MKKWLLTLIYSMFIFEPVSAQIPIIDNVSGSVSDGQQITISGSNFGANGPNVILFDDFKRGIEGEDITLTAPLGNWNVPQHQPTYGKDTQGNIAGRFIGDGGGRLIFTFSDVQEIFISYRVMIPSGKHFPHSFAPNTFPSGSQWKLTWLMDGDRGAAGNDDLVIPTWGNGTYFSIAGNDNAYQLATGRASGDTRWFSFQDWNRYSVYMKGGAIPDVDPGTVWSQGMSEEFGQKIFGSNDRRLFDGDDTPDGYQFEDDAISRWNKLNVPGWHRGGDDNAAAMYDDIYIATGAHARARIEIGDNSIYENCTALAIATPTAWQDNAISTTIRQGSFQGGETAYLFVIDENGNVSSGYPFTFGSTTDIKIDNDFDGDGKADILWRNTASGLNYLYLMDGTSVTSSGVINTVADLNWQIKGVADFNGDGKADILWRNIASGLNYLYLMDGTSVTSSGVINTVADLNWQIKGVADFNGDGKADILWRNIASGLNYLYLMDGTSVAFSGVINSVADLNWQIKGVADFNGDGKADILWRHATTGQNYLYFMNGTSIASGGGIGIANLNWQVKGVGDFSGDRKADILWRNAATGQNYLYLMDGSSIASHGGINTVADTLWKIDDTGDFNGDGKVDILWRHATSGQNYLYLMDRVSIAAHGLINKVSDADWQIQ